jgi:hypothetical protein
LDRSNDYPKLADSYFNFLAERFPVMCASDEFDFLPRAENAGRYYDKLDQIEATAIEDAIDQLKSYYRQFKVVNEEAGNLEQAIDLELLKANVAGILIELDTKRSWQYNPLLYLKIGFIGLDHGLNKPAASSAEVADRTLSRLSSIPHIIQQGVDNIRSVPETHYQASLRMVQDCREYLAETANALSKRLPGNQDTIIKATHNAETALKKFHQFLTSKSPEPDRHFAVSTLEMSLRDHFLRTTLRMIYLILLLKNGEIFWNSCIGCNCVLTRIKPGNSSTTPSRPTRSQNPKSLPFTKMKSIGCENFSVKTVLVKNCYLHLSTLNTHQLILNP